jgi:hypothetical protein
VERNCKAGQNTPRVVALTEEEKSKMSLLKHLKTLQHVSIIIQIIFRELVGSLLKSLNLKVFKIVEVNCGDVAA